MHVDANIPYGCLCTHPLHIWILKQLCPDLYIRKQEIPFRGFFCGKIQIWIIECKREVKHAQFFGKKKDYIHTTMIHQIKLIISKSGFKDLFIKNSFHSFNLGEWTIQIIKLLGSTFLWYCGTRNLSTLRIFLFFSNSARKFSLFCLFSWWEVTCIGLTVTQNRYSS